MRKHAVKLFQVHEQKVIKDMNFSVGLFLVNSEFGESAYMHSEVRIVVASTFSRVGSYNDVASYSNSQGALTFQ